MVVLAHSRGYQSYYLHLSRALVRRGQTVQQGETIGRVGQTGLATGPHLDFRIRHNGKFVNWERMDLPPAMPVAKKDLPDFTTDREHWAAMLPRFAQSQDALASSSQPESVATSAGTH
jgi:murein DD-endopeptidase MepM/ murein hydrolase activator NlpD